MLRVAVTGGIACGKSLAGSILARHGVAVCEADELAHHATEPSQPAYSEVLARFGSSIAAADGGIDRRELGRRVFACPEALADLNAIVHPRVIAAWQEWLNARGPDCAAAVLVVPLLYEVGQGEGWDAVICVAAPRAEQLRRLMRRGFSEAEALRRLESQWPVDRKVYLADYAVMNTGSPQALEEQLMRVWQEILEKVRYGREK